MSRKATATTTQSVCPAGIRLRGHAARTPGYKLTLTASGETARTLAMKSAVSGCDLTLTIDSQIQLQAEQQLQSQLVSGQSGSVIVMNPETGAVLAMASYPDYDNNYFTLPVTDSERARGPVRGDDERPPPILHSCSACIQGLFVPGSTAKLMTASIALDTEP